MDAIQIAPEGPKCEAIDVAAELRRWQSDYFIPGAAAPAAFPRFEPTFKFAYDLYLQWHREPLDNLADRIECAYERQLPPSQRLDRDTVQAIVAAVWERMGGQLHVRRLPSTLNMHRDLQSMPLPQPPPAV